MLGVRRGCAWIATLFLHSEFTTTGGSPATCESACFPVLPERSLEGAQTHAQSSQNRLDLLYDFRVGN